MNNARLHHLNASYGSTDGNSRSRTNAHRNRFSYRTSFMARSHTISGLSKCPSKSFEMVGALVQLLPLYLVHGFR